MTRHIAILGSGPIGLEAALAALEHGFSFALYEASPRAAGNVQDWGHVRLFSPWDLNVSRRTVTFLEAIGRPVPRGPDCPTGDQLLDQVLRPIAEHPSIGAYLALGARVVAVARRGLVKSDEIGTAARGDGPFRILLADGAGHESLAEADIVLDCTGSWDNPNALGDGGIPAPGERDLQDEFITRRIPDVDSEASEWSGRTTLLVGGGYSAQTAACALARLATDSAGTRVLWALRAEPSWSIDPDDPLPERSRLTAEARDVATDADGPVEAIYGVVVDRLSRDALRVAVDLRRADGELLTVAADRILSLTGGVGDASIYRQLQIHECYATSGPMKLAAALLGESGSDCLAQESHGVETLVNPEPGFFILGSKAYGRNNTFLMRVGWQQVDEVFSLLTPA